MKKTAFFFACILIIALIVPVGTSYANEADPDDLSGLTAKLDVIGSNYTRLTTIDTRVADDYNADEYSFYSQRKTFFTTDALFMYVDTNVVVASAGYKTVKDGDISRLYRFTMSDVSIKNGVEVSGNNAVAIYQGYDKSIRDFFVTMDNFTPEYVAGKFVNNGDGTYTSTNNDVLSDFFAFTASCYRDLNHTYTLTKAVFNVSPTETNTTLKMSLYATSAKDTEFVLSYALITNVGTTVIACN